MSSCAGWTTNHLCRRQQQDKLGPRLSWCLHQHRRHFFGHTRRWQEQPAGRPVFSESVCPAVSQITACGTSIFPPAPCRVHQRGNGSICARRETSFKIDFTSSPRAQKEPDRHLSYLLRFHRQHIAARLFWLMAKKCPETAKEDKFPSFCRSCVCARTFQERKISAHEIRADASARSRFAERKKELRALNCESAARLSAYSSRHGMKTETRTVGWIENGRLILRNLWQVITPGGCEIYSEKGIVRLTTTVWRVNSILKVRRRRLFSYCSRMI